MAIAKILEILLRAPTGKLDADFKKGKQLASGFVASMKSLIAPLLATASFGGFVSRINQALSSLDELAKRSVQLNFDVGDVQALELATKLAGVQFAEVEVANRKLTKQVDELSRGSRTQVELFNELGLAAGDLVNKALPEQLLAIARGFNNVEGVTRRNALAMELFGRSGNKILPLLANNGQQLADAMADIQRYTGIFDGNDLAKVEEANDAWNRLIMTFNGIFQRIAIDLAPALMVLFRTLAEAIKPGTALNEMMRSFGSTLALAVSLVTLMAMGVQFLSNIFGTLGGKLLAATVLTAALISITKALAALYTLLRIRTMALALAEAFRMLLNVKTAAAVGAAVAGMILFEKQLRGLMDTVLGLTAEQLALNDAMFDFANIDGGPGGARKLNLGSATAGSQSAIDQLFTVKGQQGGMDGIQDAVKRGNNILEQIRDGVNGIDLSGGGLDIDEVNLQ